MKFHKITMYVGSLNGNYDDPVHVLESFDDIDDMIIKCFGDDVKTIDVPELDETDDHPLNYNDTSRDVVESYFK